MKKFVVSLNLREKSVPEKIEFGRHVNDFMTIAIGTFATPSPTLASLLISVAEMEAAFNNATDGGKLLTSILHDKEAAFDTLMTALGKYVDNIAQGSETIIKSAGMDVKRDSAPIPSIDKVTGLEAKTGKNTGEVDLDWDVVRGKLVYLVYVKADGETDDKYVLKLVPSASKATITGLTAGTRYWFKVIAVGSRSRYGPDSDPAIAAASY